MKFNHSTQAQNVAALRKRFKNSIGMATAKLARWIYNNLTVAQVKAVFNLSDGQVAALRSKLLALRDKLNDIDAVGGE